MVATGDRESNKSKKEGTNGSDGSSAQSIGNENVEDSIDSISLDEGDNGSNNGSIDENGNNNNNNKDDDDDSDDKEKEPSGKDNKVLAFVNDGMSRINQAVQTSHEIVSSTTSNVSSNVSSWLGALLQTVPAPVLVALISLTSTFFGSRYKAASDARQLAEKKETEARKRKSDIERALREEYETFAGPLLKSAAKLAERLEFIVNADWDSIENRDGSNNNKDGNLSAMYSTYVLLRFLAHVEMIKRERPSLDYGFPTGDRILTNILCRIQGVLSANDTSLSYLTKTEKFFHPFEQDTSLKAGTLRISPKKQTVLGELLLRRTWDHKYCDIIKSPSNTSVTTGQKAVLTFLEFTHIYKYDDKMKCWCSTLVSDFQSLEKSARKARVGKLNEKKNKARYFGTRIYFLQNAACDLVEFFDPLPHPMSIPIHQRTRLRIGPNAYRDAMRSPRSLILLYAALANFREHRQLASSAQKLSLPNNEVEVFITGSISDDKSDARKSNEDLLKKHGNCPWSHRVLITLKEMGIPHHTIPISPTNKPTWYYLLNPLQQMPLIYYNGQVVTDSSNIVSYLIDKFADGALYRKLNSASKLKLVHGTSSLNKFYDPFMDWLATSSEDAKKETEYELRKLNETVMYAQKLNDGAPFLGGERFSREDTAIVPFLHRMEVAGRKLKNWSIPEDCTALRAYLEAARKEDSFQDTGTEEDAVLCSTQTFLKRRHLLNSRLVQSLE